MVNNIDVPVWHMVCSARGRRNMLHQRGIPASGNTSSGTSELMAVNFLGLPVDEEPGITNFTIISRVVYKQKSSKQ